jgi:hypothetical protein
LYLCARLQKESSESLFVSWCNGSTAVFGTACLGSNPSETTIFLAVELFEKVQSFFLQAKKLFAKKQNNSYFCTEF